MDVSQIIEIQPTELQKKVFENYFGYSRYIYNKGLALWKDNYEKWKINPDKNKKPSEWDIVKILKSSRSEWEKDSLYSSSQVLENSMKDLDRAFLMFGRKTKGTKVFKFPHFKTKKSSKKKSFSFHKKDPLTFKIINLNRFSMQGFSKSFGTIKMKEPIRFKKYDIKKACIKQRADKYFLILTMEVKDPIKKPKYEEDSYVGIDLGIKTFATVVDNKKNLYEFKGVLKEITELYTKIDRLNRLLDCKRNQKKKDKREVDSKRYAKMKTKLGRLYLRINNIQDNYINEVTSFLCMNYKTICIEDLKPSKMVKNRKLSKVISRVSFYEFKRQLEYKSKMYGNILVIAPKTFASTQICHHCGHQLKGENKLRLSKRIYRCPECGIKIGRDMNAAINLAEYGRKFRDGLHL